MNAAVFYRIGASHPEAHIFEVELVIAKPASGGQQVSLPNWIPGSYMIRDFSRHILCVAAFDENGVAVPIEKLNKSTWRCAPAQGALTLCYQVYAWDLSVRGAHLDQTHAFFNGTSVFLCVEGKEHEPHVVQINAPVLADQRAEKNWQVATSLSRLAQTPEWGFGEYSAINYDELIDHPVEMGTFTHAQFIACGVQHEVVITGVHRTDMTRLTQDLEKICSAQIKMFGEPAPFNRYVFLVMAVGSGYGGLEHRASTALLCSRDDLPLATEPHGNLSERYKTFLGLCSHEYFHSWNVKRIKPAVFIPYDLRQETFTPLLWAFEGITSYYDDLMLARAGLITPAQYLELLAQHITRHLRTPGRKQQSVSDSSMDAWTKYYKQDENSPNAIVSYYIKGALIALCLDLLLREKTNNRASLDDVMRRLWADFGTRGIGIGDTDIQRIAAELCGDDLADFWQNALHGTDELPLAALLQARGVQWTLRGQESASYAGGKAGTLTQPRSVIGLKAQNAEGGAGVQNIYVGSAAMRAGLSAGDVVVAVNGLRVNAITLDKIIASYAVAEILTIHAFRRDELMVFQVTVEAAAADTCVLALPTDARLCQSVIAWVMGADVAV